MARYIEGSEANPDWLNGKTVAMLGYGNQGRPQARNLQDSGVNVLVGLYESSTKWQTAIDDGMEVVPTEVAAARGDFLMLCLPDTAMADIYSREIASHVQPGKTLAFCHGFNIRFGLLEPPPDVDVVLIGPKGTGPHLRREFESGRGVPSLVAVHQDASGHAMDIAMAYAWGIGSARSFLLETTFAEETESDLFG
jgi:ketol-acid reductoisomerase